MPASVIRQCVRKACGFRFPGPDQDSFACPKCNSATLIVRKIPPQPATAPELDDGLQIEAGLDNIRSALNVGSILRSSDGAGVRAIHLFGICPSPAQSQVQKTSLGADESIPWVQHWDGLQAVREKKAAGYQIWALEKTENSTNLFDLRRYKGTEPILLVVGNEVSGVDPDILQECERVLHIPMMGNKESLNVSNAYAIAIYWLRFGVETDNK